MATTHSSILAWKIPWTENSGELQSMGKESDATDSLYIYTHTHTHAYTHTHTHKHMHIRCLLLGRKVMTNLESILKAETLLCQKRSI